MTNKAHTTVLNRLLARYHGATTATLSENLPELLALDGPVYIAVTNQESLAEALRLTADTKLGVMNSRGDIIKVAT
jgi:hypothetical protein